MHDEQQRQPDACTPAGIESRQAHHQQEEHSVYSRPPARQPCGAVIVPAGLHGGHRPSARAGRGASAEISLQYRFGSWQKALRSIYDGKASEFLKNPRRSRTGRSCVTSARQRGCGYEGQAVLLSG